MAITVVAIFFFFSFLFYDIFDLERARSSGCRDEARIDARETTHLCHLRDTVTSYERTWYVCQLSSRVAKHCNRVQFAAEFHRVLAYAAMHMRINLSFP